MGKDNNNLPFTKYYFRFFFYFFSIIALQVRILHFLKLFID